MCSKQTQHVVKGRQFKSQRVMTVEECTKLMINALIEGHLSIDEIADKYCASPELRDSLIADLKKFKWLYNSYKNII